jgi:phage terminase Nu1 subunit (DNA packaging protein)
MTEISTRDLARLLGVAERTVRDIAARPGGILVRAGRGFDRDESVRNYCAHLRRAKTGQRGEGVAMASEERRRLARLQADALELKIKRESGALIAESVVESEWAEIVTRVRNAILIEPERIGAELGLPRASVAVIDRHLRDALSGLARGAK